MSSRLNDYAIDDIHDDVDENDDHDVFIGIGNIEREDGV